MWIQQHTCENHPQPLPFPRRKTRSTVNERAEGLAGKIRAAREALGYTQVDLAAQLGRGGSVRAIQDWEAGISTPRPHMLVKVRSVLNMPGDEQETRAGWSSEAQVVVAALAEHLSGHEPDERAAFLRRVIEIVVQGQRPDATAWPDDVQVIADMLGAFLARNEGQ